MTAEGAPRAKLNAVVKTDVGVVRDHNEDSAFADEEGRFFIVADGMGGHAAGEVASAMAVETVQAELSKESELFESYAAGPTDSQRQRIIQVLEHAVREAHRAVFERGARESDKQGMGTTLDVLLVAGCDAFVAHVGDSRTYLIREGRAAQVTTDHTVAEVLVIEGKLTAEEAASSPLRTVLVNAIGVAAEVGVEMAHLRLVQGDYLLLCSDGLHDYFPEEQEIADRALDDSTSAEESLQGMIEAAKERGGHDNITGVLIEVVSAPEVQEAAPEAAVAAEAAVPQEVGRDDTMPVDADSLAEARRRIELGVATTDEHPAAVPDEEDDDLDQDEAPTLVDDGRPVVVAADGEDDEDDEDDEAHSDDGDATDSDEDLPSRGADVKTVEIERPRLGRRTSDSDLRSTVPIRTLKSPPGDTSDDD